MKITLGIAVVASLAATLFGGSQQLSQAGLERAILTQMNAGSHTTRRVDCKRVGPLAAGSGRYVCTLVGTRGSEHALVSVTGNTWRADWAPLQG
jgi:hypothetical protein